MKTKLILKTIELIAAVIALAASSAYGSESHAVVKIGGCSGVCVDPSGLIMTVKHCDLPETTTVRFPEIRRQAQVRRVYVARESEGPVVFEVIGSESSEPWPWVSVASEVPTVGEQVYSLGYPARGSGSQMRAEGSLTRGSQFTFRGGAFLGNAVDFFTGPGWSGGPLFNAQGQVVGLLSNGDSSESVYTSFASTRQAYERVASQAHINCPDGRCPLLPPPSRPPVTAPSPAPPPGGGTADTIPDDGRCRCGEEPSVDLIDAPPAPVEIEDEPEFEPAEIDWGSVHIVLMLAERETSLIRGAMRSRAISLAIGPLERAVRERTGGKATLDVVSQRLEPDRYEAVVDAARVDPDPAYVVVIVGQQDIGRLRSLIRGRVVSMLDSQLESRLKNAPVEVVFERAMPGEVEAIRSALSERGGDPESSDDDDDEGGELPWWVGLVAGIGGAAKRRYLDQAA